MNALGEYIMFLRMTKTTTTVVLETLNLTATAIMVHALQKKKIFNDIWNT